MHSFDAPSGRTYHHNGDFSGDVRLITTVEVLTDDRQSFVQKETEIDIPFADLAALVAEYVRRERASALDSMGTGEILGIPGAGR
jgi:hypothetical protein